jgi:aminopeptidase-like protein
MTTDTIGHEMHRLITELYPICRSITGNGFRETLNAVRRHIPLELHEVPSGTKVFDWTVPREWNIRDAYVKNGKGERVIDFQKLNLHVLNYSVPVNAKMSLADLKPHLFSLPDHPDWVPYRTSYYAERWGFCVSHNQLLALKDEVYDVCIDSTLADGQLTYGELFVPGQSSDEILVTCHACHPSLANDNLSGVALTTFLAKQISQRTPHHSYRFLFIPGTIGSITWLARNEDKLANIKHGLVISGVGDRGHVTYKKSRRDNAEIDRAATHVLQHSGQGDQVVDFFPYGYDERQFCSPGINLPVGCFMRTPWGQYPEYHTSADNLDFVAVGALADSFAKCTSILSVLENNKTYVNLNPKCEPQLGKHGLYQALGGNADAKAREMAMLWVLNLSDGTHSLLDVAERSHVPFEVIRRAADDLREHSLLKEHS